MKIYSVWRSARIHFRLPDIQHFYLRFVPFNKKENNFDTYADDNILYQVVDSINQVKTALQDAARSLFYENQMKVSNISNKKLQKGHLNRKQHSNEKLDEED